ncbi:hypothetical protein KKB64_02190 [Patescibacteria group bacterium]|nr:hypothetical protein [Patescibacteria group bacterium]MBU1472578.1 hypothetical protein [Patescibacteria group bacterium]MBU2459829.1 hypothetical protein [Patescibacteria group bacterium]MBU2544110.1 hypothetical protein [Patescibacteria group bacterium]
MKLGSAFSDTIIIERKAKNRITKDDPVWWVGTGRTLLFATLFFVAILILVLRLFRLTVIQGHELRQLADSNRTRELIRHAPRGILRDRTGKPLVANTASYRLIKPCEGGIQGEGDITACTLRLTGAEGEALLKKGLPQGNYLEVDWLRTYLYGSALSHVVGYTGELTAEELREDYYSLRQYKSGDRVGRTGAEAVFEERLRGRDGKELVEVDASVNILRTLGRQEEVPGEDVTLSLDAGLVRVAAEAFPQGESGAVVVSKPATGEILAMYSSPSFSPDAFSSWMSREEYQLLQDDQKRPLFNRAIGGVYPPGSVFKIVTALSALEEGAVGPNTTVEDEGVISIGQFTFPNWYFLQYGKTDGTVDIIKALQRSNDIFFYKTGEWLGITKLAAWAERLGIGKPLGIELAGEASGLMPDPAWKNQRFDTKEDLEKRNNEWYLGDTYHVSIGQGYLLTTPLQMNAWTNVIANEGKLCRPTIEKVKSLLQRRTSLWLEKSPSKADQPLAGKVKSECKDLGIKKETIELVTEGMKKACESGGTGWPLFGFSVIPAKAGIQSSVDPTGSPVGAGDDKLRIPVACKTGTAEFGPTTASGQGQTRTHAWFTVFAPLPRPGLDFRDGTLPTDTISGEPEISVTVLVEGAGEGSNVAAPVAKKILEEWFSR